MCIPAINHIIYLTDMDHLIVLIEITEERENDKGQHILQ